MQHARCQFNSLKVKREKYVKSRNQVACSVRCDVTMYAYLTSSERMCLYGNLYFFVVSADDMTVVSVAIWKGQTLDCILCGVTYLMEADDIIRLSQYQYQFNIKRDHFGTIFFIFFCSSISKLLCLVCVELSAHLQIHKTENIDCNTKIPVCDLIEPAPT